MTSNYHESLAAVNEARQMRTQITAAEQQPPQGVMECVTRIPHESHRPEMFCCMESGRPGGER